MQFLTELKRRNVFKVGAAYLVVAWLLTQIAVSIEAPLRLPEWFDTAVIVLLAIGFPVALILAWAFDLTPEGVKLASSVDPGESTGGRRSGRTLDYLIIGALSLAVVFLVVDNYVLDGADGSAAATSTNSPVSAPAAEETAALASSIAILPFETLGNDAQNTDFAEGVYADIFYELEKLDRLTVIGRRTMRRYENTQKSYQEIAVETNAQSVLELLVRFVDNRVRINVELVRVDGTAENRLWTQAYEDEYTSGNFFEIQTDIARNIAERLVGELSPTEEARLTEVLTEDTEALAYYLRALPYADDGTQENADNCLEPISRAVALDPDFKEAWYRKGVCHDVRAIFYPNLVQEERQLAVAALERAIAIDDAYAEAHVYLSAALASGGNWPAAGGAYRRALDSGVQRQDEITTFRVAIGHLREALEVAQRQFDRDPEGSGEIGTTSRMRLHEALGDSPRSDQTYQLGRRLYEPWPAGSFDRLVVLMGRARQGRIEPGEVARYFRDTFASFSAWHMGLAEIFDERDAVAAYLRERIGDSLGNPFNQLDIAAHAAYVGEPELALEALMNSLSFFAINVGIVWMPVFRDVRQLDAFKDYLREIGMVDVWRELGWPDLCAPTGGDDFRCD